MRFFLGMVTGVVAGMLLAPDSGKKNREKLNRDWPKYKAKANEALEMTKEAYSDVTRNLGLTKEHLPQEQELTASNGRTSNGSTKKSTSNGMSNGTSSNR